MPREFDEDKPKRSWRDIDRNKDRSKHRQPDRPAVSPKNKVRADSASKVYKSQLDAFFEGKAKAPEHVKEKLIAIAETTPESKERLEGLRAIKEAVTSSAADAAVAAYLLAWELPPDFDVISQVLVCANEDHVRLALETLGALLADKRVPRHTQLLEQRLRRVKTLSDDPELAKTADDLIKKIRLFT